MHMQESQPGHGQVRHSRRACVRGVPLAAFLAALVSIPTAQAERGGNGNGEVSYCNLTSLTWKSMSNAVRISVAADGILDFESPDRWDRYGTRIRLRFPQARSKLDKSSYHVNSFPVASIQTSIPEGAEQGIGVDMLVTLQTGVGFAIEQSPDQQSVIITVDKPYTVEDRGNGVAAAAATVDTKLSVVYAGELLDVSSVKADIHQLLGEIAKQTGANIAVDDVVQREVSMSLTRLPVGEVIRAIASAYGLAVSETQGCYRISDGVPDTLATYNVSGTQSFPIKHLRPEAARQLLPNFLFNYVSVNDQQNAIVATAPTQMLDKIRSDLEKVDQPLPQIMIEALAVEFTTTDDLNLGITVQDTNSTFDRFLSTLDGTLRYSTIGALPEDFVARLHALEQAGKAKIHANPRMAATNGRQRAKIFIGAQRFIRVEYLSYGRQSEKIQGVNVGITLEVSPWTGGNGEVTMDVEPTVSNIQEIDEQTGLPVLSTRTADTDVRVKDGETVVIGGLTLQQEFKTKSKVPILGDIPLIGELFKSRRNNRVNSELVIFVTPHILTERGRLQDEAKETQLRERFLGAE